MRLISKYIFAVICLTTISSCVSNNSNPWERPATYKSAEEKPSTLSTSNRWSGKHPNEQLADNSQNFDDWYKNQRTIDQTSKMQSNKTWANKTWANKTGANKTGANKALQIDASYNSQQPPVKIALLVPLSGKNAHLGNALLNAAQLALFDMAPSNFEIIPRDTKGTAAGAREAANSAVKEGVQLIIGPLFSHSAKAVKPIARSNNINMLTFSTDWSLSGYNTFVMGFLPFSQVDRIVNYAVANNYQKLGVFAPQNSYGNAVISTYRRVAYNAGIPAMDIIQFPPYDTNISPLLRSFTIYDQRVEAMNQKIRPLKERLKKDPENLDIVDQIRALERNGDTFGELPFDAILLPVGGEQAVSIANLLSFYDLDPDKVKRLGLGLWDDAALATEKNLKDGWFAAPSPYLRKKFEKRYSDTYGQGAPRLVTLAYDATALSVLLAKNAHARGEINPFTRQSLTNPNGFMGIDGIFRFRTDGLIERGLAILEYKDGAIEVLEEAPSTFENYRY